MKAWLFVVSTLMLFVLVMGAKNKTSNVKVATTSNFRNLITKAKADVLIEFYAPWCGHCKALAPKYKKLANRLKNDDVIIAKMDVTSNTAPDGYKVSGVPAIYWLPKNSKVPIEYRGPGEVADLFKFVAKHSTDGLKNYDKTGKKRKPNEL
ncbi:Thioredoxin domain-containing protein [Aphelenchoides bicaudatus]|nr:Thioredoxin domain-containing protein [Aphelenchoides bicaudatus]